MNFCDSTGAVVHDKVPRNEQNTHCNGKSAWEVMSTLSDFQTDYNASRNGQAPPNITFRLVQHQSPPTTQIVTATIATTSSGSIGKELAPKCDQDIVCLCLDVSSSMRGDRIETMSHSAQAYIISFLKEGTAVGIVAFESSARTVVGMTVITSTATRSWLADQVPTTSGGSTGIGSGLKKCHEMLQNYAGSEIGKTRIFLLSDGAENESPVVAGVLPSIREDGIVVDTVLYGQSAVSYSIDEITGGLNMFISDMTGKVGLDLFFAETANGRCEASSDEAIVNNEEIVLGPGKSAYSDIIYFDKTIGVNTKLVFKYQGDINVTVSTPENHTVIINPYPKSQIIDAVIVGQVKREVHYTITKLGHLDRTVSVVTSITSNLVPGVEPITIKNRVNNDNIQFSKDSEIINYVGVFQGLTPISGLTINMLMEQPDGSVTVVKLADDGTGKDSIANDGIYTGFTPSHNIRGQGFFSSKVVVSGEGKLPDSASVAPGTRRKRCVGCDISLGNITRTTTGKVVVVNNWIVVPDSTPPQKITDAEILSAVSEKQIFTIGWTAPGDDLNLGQVALYEFAVSINISRSQLVSLPAEAILSNVSAYVVPAGTKLELMINTSKINSTIFGLDEAADVSTYYIRIRAADAAGNVAEWSNPVSVTYIDPSRYITPVVFPEVSSDGPAAKGSTAAMAMVLVRPLLPSMLEIW